MAQVLLLLMPAVAAAQILPVMGDGNEMTLSAERRLGDDIARELYRDPDYLDDPIVGDYVQGIWQKLLAAARARGEISSEMDEHFAWIVLLGRDRTINAFALPGGYLGLHLGLIGAVGSPDELATVLGHELSHVTQRHITRNMARQSRQMPLVLAGMVLGMIAAGKSRNADAGQAMVMGSQAAFMQNELAYSRDMEREADRIGFGVMTQAGYAPRGAAAMFGKLQHASRLNDNGSYPYLRSHPLTSERMADMEARTHLQPGAEPSMPLSMEHAMVSARARVLARPGVDVLRQWMQAAAPGGDAGQPTPSQQAGLLYAAAKSALELRDVPAARAAGERLQALTANQPAAARQARLLRAEIDLAAGEPARVVEQLQKDRQRPELLLAAQAATASHQPAPLVAPLRDWVALHPRDASAWRALAALHNEEGQPVRAVRAEAEAAVSVLDYAGARDRYRAAQEMIRQAGRNGGPVVDYYEASIIDTRSREVEALFREQEAERRDARR